MTTAFQNAVDTFMATKKSLTGIGEWRPAQRVPEQSIFWRLEMAGQLTDHQIKIDARVGSLWNGFCILLQFNWLGSYYVVMRMNADDPFHTHLNRPPRPAGISAQATGNRQYLWRDNRHAFTPATRHLPFARKLPDGDLHVGEALKNFLALANVDPAGTPMPSYPKRQALF